MGNSESNLSKKLLRESFPLAGIATLLIILASCGGSGQDEPNHSNSSQTVSGVVVDGYLARATVFIDTNNNGSRDPWEAFAFTDNEGYYSFNPNTNTNYCASTATAQQQQYCLAANTDLTNSIIRIDGGYDISTGEPFLGAMSRRITATDSTKTENLVVSPITSLLSSITDSSEQTTLLTAMGIEESDLNVDYLNTDGAGSINSNLLNTALKVHKTVTILSDRLTDTYTEIGDEIGTPNDVSSTLYPYLAERIINERTTLDAALTNNSVLISALDASETALRKVYEQEELTLPTDLGSTSDTSNFDRVVNVAANIPRVVDNLIDVNQSDFSLADATGATRALESLVIKTVNETTVNETNTTDTTIDNAINFFTTESNQLLIDSLTNSLSSGAFDITSLTKNDFSGDDFDSIEEVASAASLGSDITAFTRTGGMSLKLSNLDLGVPTDLKDQELLFFFDGTATDIEGSMTVCIKFIDEANSDGTLGEGNTRGELVEGFWSLLGASENNVSSFSLLTTITFLGTTYQFIIKPSNLETIDDVEYKSVRIDNQGDIRTSYSLEGFTETPSSIPNTNAECEAVLPSRVGLG